MDIWRDRAGHVGQLSKAGAMSERFQSMANAGDRFQHIASRRHFFPDEWAAQWSVEPRGAPSRSKLPDSMFKSSERPKGTLRSGPSIATTSHRPGESPTRLSATRDWREDGNHNFVGAGTLISSKLRPDLATDGASWPDFAELGPNLGSKSNVRTSVGQREGNLRTSVGQREANFQDARAANKC